MKNLITIGTFDGVHQGHQHLFNLLETRAALHQAKPLVLYFPLPPKTLQSPHPEMTVLTLPEEKKAPEQKSSGAKIEWLAPDKCNITLTEGKFHEVRRIFSALGNEVAELRRISIGEFNIQHLQKKAELISDTESFIQKLLS